MRIMIKTRFPFLKVTLLFLLFFVVCIFFSAGTINLTIGRATPFTVLPLLIAFSILATPMKSAMTGLVIGIFLDSTTGETYCFNAVVLMFVACFACLVANNLFNKNIKATYVISLLSSIAYYLLYWIFFFIFGYSLKDSLTYLIRDAFPTAIYTSLFIFPFYFILKYLNKLKK